ncbi:hypothetical protein BHM03_00049703 [Ensete ventricosum]|nr:hypothetical protein BHM03_00049703 [Ensete ventricosum]
MAGINIEKPLSSRLGCGGAAGGWSKLLLVVALVTSAGALFASFSSNFGVSVWFSAPSSLLASHRDVVANSSTEELVLPPPRASSPPLAPLLPPASLSQDVDTLIGSPVFFAPPPSPVKDADDLDEYAGEYDPKMPPLGPEIIFSPLFLIFILMLELSPFLTLHDLLIQTDRQLMYAKREIASAPAGLNDPDLHSPLFLNVSIFKR